jgi:hypothetical protein
MRGGDTVLNRTPDEYLMLLSGRLSDPHFRISVEEQANAEAGYYKLQDGKPLPAELSLIEAIAAWEMHTKRELTRDAAWAFHLHCDIPLGIQAGELALRARLGYWTAWDSRTPPPTF